MNSVAGDPGISRWVQYQSWMRKVTITRRGQPIGRLLPLRSKRRMPSHADLRAGMSRLKDGSEKHIRAERDER